MHNLTICGVVQVIKAPVWSFQLVINRLKLMHMTFNVLLKHPLIDQLFSVKLFEISETTGGGRVSVEVMKCMRLKQPLFTFSMAKIFSESHI